MGQELFAHMLLKLIPELTSNMEFTAHKLHSILESGLHF